MPTFKIRAINTAGEKFKTVRDSADKFSLYAEMKQEGNTLVSADEQFSRRKFFQKIAGEFNHVPEQQKIIFTKNLGNMIAAGLPIAKSLSVIQKQIKNKYFKSVIANIEADIKKGKTISESTKEYKDVFSPLFVAMSKAGEESGTLSDSLKIIGEQMESIYKLKKKIKGAMIYPVIIIIVMIIIGILMLIFVVPSISAVFKDLHTELPLSTRILIFLSDFVKDHYLIFVETIIAIYFAIYFFLRTPFGKRFTDFVLIHMPTIGGLVKETNSARIARTLSSLLSSGVPYSEAILITAEVIQNNYYRKLLDEARIKVEKGENISTVFLANEKISPIFVGEMMGVGEETGEMPKMLLEVALYYENSVDQKTKDMSAIIEPVLMVFIGVFVGFFAFSMIKPIYSVMDTL